MNQVAQHVAATTTTIEGRSRWGIRAKVFSLVVVAVLLPTVLVGTSAYWTARDVLTEKLSERLNTRASLAAASVSDWFQQRQHDASVFASSNLVNSGDAALIEAYLGEVRGRFPMYSGLSVSNVDGSSVAIVGEIADAEPAREPMAIEWRQGPASLLVQHPIRGNDGTVQGYLTMRCTFAALGDELVDDASLERVILVSPRETEDRVVMAEPPDANLPRVGSYTVDGNTLVERQDSNGSSMLAAARSVDVAELGEPLIVHVETERRAAFSAVDTLRNQIVGISAIVGLVVLALAFGLTVSLTRPLESLTRGAHAVSNGDYSVELAVGTHDEIGYLTQVFNHMTVTLKDNNERLEHLSTTDELTKLVNRRQLRTALAATLLRAKRTELPFSLVMIDIDHFKAFNDKFGHIKGDELLAKLGSFLLTNLRGSDVAARYGGEEFLLVLPETSIEEAKNKARQLQSEFASSYDGNGKVTLSMGVAAWPRDGVTGRDIIDAADRALYSAKKQGRDRVVVSRKRARQRKSVR